MEVVKLPPAQSRALRCIAAYWRVWVEWSQDSSDVKLAAFVRQGRIGSRTWDVLRKKEMIDTTKRKDILGGGQATPVTDRAREYLKSIGVEST